MKQLMSKCFALLAVLFLFAGTAQAQQSVCLNATLIQSIAISITSPASTRIVLNTDTEKQTYICGINLTMVGAATANTVLVQYGTGASCQTGTTTLTGAFTASTAVGSSTVLALSPSIMKPTPAGFSTCLLTTTVDAVKGVVSFVIQ